MVKQNFKTKVQPDEGLFIETWVGAPDDVVTYFTLLKASQRDGENSALAEEPGEQGRLNRIVASLEFED